MPALGRRVRRGRTQARTWLVLGCSPQLVAVAASLLPQHLPRGPSGPLPHCLLRTPLCTVGEAEARPFSHPQQCGWRNQSIKVVEPPKSLSHSFCTFSSCDQHLGSQHLVPHLGRRVPAMVPRAFRTPCRASCPFITVTLSSHLTCSSTKLLSVTCARC